MKSFFYKLLPINLILFGFLVLFMTDIGIAAGTFILIGYVMLIERIWPEKWGQK